MMRIKNIVIKVFFLTMVNYGISYGVKYWNQITKFYIKPNFLQRAWSFSIVSLIFTKLLKYKLF